LNVAGTRKKYENAEPERNRNVNGMMAQITVLFSCGRSAGIIYIIMLYIKSGTVTRKPRRRARVI